jgi:pimeloyl-ACP methyl ester carboxylesterase
MSWATSPGFSMCRFSGLCLVLALIALPARADGPIVLEGALNGANYRIYKPANWNGGLVLFAHGSQDEAPGPGAIGPEPLEAHLARGNYAWAASGFRATGYHQDWFLDDTLALREKFIQSYGEPRWSVIHGESMGGHVAIAALELHPEVFQGALIECGLVDGIGFFDWSYAYSAAAEYFSGLPIIDTPKWAFDALRLRQAFTLLMGAPGTYNEHGKRFDSVVKNLSGGDLPLRQKGMLDRSTRLFDPEERPGNVMRYADTRQIQYEIDPELGVDAATLNRRIRRIVPADDARSRRTNPVFAEVTGNIRAPVLTLHNTADFFVPFALEQDYRRRTLAAGTSALLVQRAVREAAHCFFHDTVRENAFDDLVAWIEHGTVPWGDDVLGDVDKLGRRAR